MFNVMHIFLQETFRVIMGYVPCFNVKLIKLYHDPWNHNIPSLEAAKMVHLVIIFQ